MTLAFGLLDLLELSFLILPILLLDATLGVSRARNQMVGLNFKELLLSSCR